MCRLDIRASGKLALIIDTFSSHLQNYVANMHLIFIFSL